MDSSSYSLIAYGFTGVRKNKKLIDAIADTKPLSTKNSGPEVSVIKSALIQLPKLSDKFWIDQK